MCSKNITIFNLKDKYFKVLLTITSGVLLKDFKFTSYFLKGNVIEWNRNIVFGNGEK